MRNTHRARAAALAVAALTITLAAACVPPPDPGPAPEYDLIVLDNGVDGGSAQAISPNGELIGGNVTDRVDGVPVTSGATWDDHGHLTVAAPIEGLSAGVNAIDDSGEAVGASSINAETDWPSVPAEMHGDHWHQIDGVGEPTPFGTANGISGDVVVGTAYDGDDSMSTPWVHADGATSMLGSFGGATGMAYDVNTHGTVVGWSRLGTTEWRNAGFVVDHEQTLADAVQIEGLGANWTFPRAINDNGVVAGDGGDAEGVTRGWLWDEVNGIRAVIDPEPGASTLVVRAINNDGQVVGYGPTASDGWVSFIWDETSGKRLLEDLVDLPDGWRLRNVHDLSDTGRIVGEAIDAGGVPRPVLLRPVGEVEDPHEDPTEITDDSHLDVVSVELHDGHLHLGIDHANHADLLHPEDVVITLGESNETAIGSQPGFAPLGPAGADLWTLDGGWSVHDVALGDFVGDTVTLHLRSVEGPGALGVWRFDSFGDPLFDFVSSAPFPQSLDVAHNAHAHRNWSFTAPGEYTVEIEVTGTLAASGQTISSGVESYTFEVDHHDH